MTPQDPPPAPDDNGPTQGLPSYGSYDPPPPGGTPPPYGSTPPPYGSTPPPVGGSSPFSPVDAVGYGWKKFRENAGPIFLAGFILIAASIAFSILGNVVTGDSAGTVGVNFSLGGAFFQVLSTLAGYIVSAAIIRGMLDVTEGRTFDLGAAIGNLNFGNVIIASLVLSVLEVIGFILFVIPGILFAFFTIFAMYFVVDKDQSPIDAIKSSYELIRAHIGDTLLLILLSIAVIVVGFIALCVGIFVALPIVLLAWAYAYKKFLGEPIAA